MRPTMRAAGGLVLLPCWIACVTVAEHRKLEHEVAVLQKRVSAPGGEAERLADLSVELDELRAAISLLNGRVEQVEHRTQLALQEARAARQGAAPAAEPSAAGPLPEDARADASDEAAAELKVYRAAHSAWRADDTEVCIDRFQEFLQTYPASSYADDAAYWMADCYFKQGDYRAAVLRFDDVASGYPTGDKAADALYRQGEALLRLGPGYSKAARRAFERVSEEYPDSPRVAEARRQLEILGGR